MPGSAPGPGATAPPTGEGGRGHAPGKPRVPRGHRPGSAPLRTTPGRRHRPPSGGAAGHHARHRGTAPGRDPAGRHRSASRGTGRTHLPGRPRLRLGIGPAPLRTLGRRRHTDGGVAGPRARAAPCSPGLGPGFGSARLGPARPGSARLGPAPDPGTSRRPPAERWSTRPSRQTASPRQAPEAAQPPLQVCRSKRHHPSPWRQHHGSGTDSDCDADVPECCLGRRH